MGERVMREFYVLLTVHPCIILQISATRCTILLNIFISLLYMFRGSMCSSSGEKLYLCDNGICHSLWVVSGLLIGLAVLIIRRKLLYICVTGICHFVWVASGL